MIVNYCSKCGNKIEQSGQIANFCPKCGQNLKTLTQTAAQAPIQDNEEEVVAGEFDIEALKGKIKVSVDLDIPKVITVGDVINEAKQTGPVQNDLGKRDAPNLPKGKDLLKTIAKECASSREKSSEIE